MTYPKMYSESLEFHLQKFKLEELKISGSDVKEIILFFLLLSLIFIQLVCCMYFDRPILKYP